MSKKEYSLVSTEPLTDFDRFILAGLDHIAEHHGEPRAALIAVLDKYGNVGTCYHNADISDMILLKGYIGLDILREYQEASGRPFEDDRDEDDGEEG